MRGIFKTFRFWLAFISLAIVVIEIFGFDEYAILLALISPVVWISINFPVFNQIVVFFPIVLTYVITVFFWFMVGMVLDRIIRRLKSKSHDEQ
ncbi:hypothetical protein J1TS5_56750 [Paenibacillus macerans]|nr:hypothetical protein J1TS5_56750 [Paenibacillus macerans]